MRYTLLGLFLFASSTTAADDAESKNLLKQLEGTYKLAAAERSGGPPPAGFLELIDKVTISGNKFIMSFKKDKDAKDEENSATISVDATRKPAQIDLKADSGKKTETVLGILLIEGDTVKICWSDTPEAKRPVDFKTSKDDKNMMLTLQRMK